MDGLQAVVTAKKQALKYFSDEGIRRLGLEELKYDENKNWRHVTLSFDLYLEDMDIFEAQPATPRTSL